MKKTLSFIVATILLFPKICFPVHANNSFNARWINTKNIVITHEYYDGEADCCISISALPNSSITNVDISFDEVIGDYLINIATWNDLSSNTEFLFVETVQNIAADKLYRLSFSADIINNGVTETISRSYERFYTSN